MIMIAMLLPNLTKSRESARRVQCIANLRQIHIGVTNYAVSNHGVYLKCRFRQVQIAFNLKRPGWLDGDTDWIEQLKLYGIDPEGSVWSCPSRDYKGQVEPWYHQMVVGYQYFGGIETWRNPWGVYESRSPISISQAEPRWAMAADTACKIDGAWGGGRATAYQGMPSHASSHPWPDGAHNLYVDGSVEWVEFKKLIYIHSWSGSFRRMCYWYQEDLGGFDPPLEAYAEP